MPTDLDRSDVAEGEIASIRELREDELGGRDTAVGQEVGAGVDRGRVDAEVAKHGGVATKSCASMVYDGPGRLRRGLDRGKHAGAGDGIEDGRQPGSMAFWSGITAAPSSLAAT